MEVNICCKMKEIIENKSMLNVFFFYIFLCIYLYIYFIVYIMICNYIINVIFFN